jgi:hypothetical protein
MSMILTPDQLGEIKARAEESERAPGDECWLEKYGADAHADRASLLASHQALEERVKELEEALLNFLPGSADMERLIWKDFSDDETVTITAKLGRFRTARRLLTGAKP